jgi:elongation factor G
MIYETQHLRNVALLGHSGAGKTTFAETMLFEAGAISRRGKVEEGSTVSDYTDIERERGNSIFSTLMHASWKDSKINILDTPGFDDFIGEVVSALKVADTAVVMVNAKNGVEVGTEIIWEYIEEFETPALFVVNQVDHEKANFDATVEQITERFGSRVVPFQYPYNPGNGFNAIIDALRMTMYVFSPDGGKPEKQDIPASELERAKAMHNAIVEAAAENDEGLMERYFEQGTLTERELTKGLRIAISHQQLFPLFCCSASQNMGSGRIMGFINDVCPSPADRPAARLDNGEQLPCVSSESPTIFIYKTISEPRVGNVSYFKVYSGTLKPSEELINQANQSAERFTQLYLNNGKSRDAVQELRAGDLGVTVKLKNSHTNQTLTGRQAGHRIRPMSFPEPRLRVAVAPPSKNDMEKLMRALHTIQEEDLTLKVAQSAELRQTILEGQGQLHLDLIRYRIEKVNGVSMDFFEPRIPYRETITRRADASYRHKKQSGGAGQFAEVHLRIEPWHEGIDNPADLSVRNTEVEELPWGGKLVFLWCVVGGSIDSKYSNAIKKGILQKMEEGPLTGSNCQDIRVCITEGKMHPVDSNDMAFMIAGAQAFKEAFIASAPQLLEPIYELDILCNDEVMGDIMGDLQTRRAIIAGMDSEGRYQKIIAKVPLAELYQYSSTLRSLSQGRAKFHLQFSEYSPVPGDIQQRLIEQHKTEQDE